MFRYVLGGQTTINCDRITSYLMTAGDTLRVGQIKSVQLQGDYFFEDDYLTSVFLTVFNTKSLVLTTSDFFAATAVTFRRLSGQVATLGIAKSHVQLDGRSDFLILSIDGSEVRYYNISGLITPNGLFSGTMEIDPVKPKVGLSGSVVNATRLILNPSAADALVHNISSIELDLK